MKKTIISSILLCIFQLTAFGQQSVEAGLNVGFSTYLGDLQPKSFTFKHSDFVIGAQGKYNFNSRLSGRLSLNYGQIRGNDKTTGQADLEIRNLSFKSSIKEIALVGEFNLLNFGSHKDNLSSREYYKISPYVFGGINIFKFNPQANYNGQWFDLQPLGTEGQGVPSSGKEKYNLTQIALPFGFGMKYQLNQNLIMSFELGWRKTFTDYLDDVSGTYYDLNQLSIHNGELSSILSFRGDELSSFDGNSPNTGFVRGNSNNDDWYLMNTLTVSYKLLSNRDRNGSKRNED